MTRTTFPSNKTLPSSPGSIEDIYELSPMQQGMLFHTLLSPEVGTYCSQYSIRLRGLIDPDLFYASWQILVDRHPILRTSFEWEGLSRPVQVVHRTVRITKDYRNWQGATVEETIERVKSFLEEDLNRGFELNTPPLLRLALFRIAEGEYELVWTNHHLLLDGWSRALLLDEFMTVYAAEVSGGAWCLPSRRPFRDYISLTRTLDEYRAKVYWQETLAGFRELTPLSSKVSSSLTKAQPPQRLGRSVPAAITQAAGAFVRREHLTFNTVLQGAWALTLAHLSEARDIVFGTVVSGRSPEFDGVEEMIGLFINTLPVRLKIGEGISISDWLQSVQQILAQIREFETFSIVDIKRWAGVSSSVPLFDSIFVFENYPTSSIRSRSKAFEIGPVKHWIRQDFPLVLSVRLSEELILTLNNERAILMSEADRLLKLYIAVLEKLPGAEALTVEAFLSGMAEVDCAYRKAREEDLSRLSADKLKSIKRVDRHSASPLR